jgi:hypothetical protein
MIGVAGPRRVRRSVPAGIFYSMFMVDSPISRYDVLGRGGFSA